MDYDKELMALKDEDNAVFAKSLIPGDHVLIGARLPDMRELAKRIAKSDWRGYLGQWRPRYFEDYMLRGMVIGYVKVDLDERLELYRGFIPLIDNWSVCDSFCSTWKPKASEKERVWDFIVPYLHTDDEFRMRFAAVMMMDHFIDDDHIERIISELDSVDNEGYYFRMGKSWALSVCFVKYPDMTMDYLENCDMDAETMRMTVRKIRDSYRVTDEMKERVRGLV